MMVQDFTDLLLVYPSQQQLLKQWTVDVIPAIYDTEATVVEKTLEVRKDIVIWFCSFRWHSIDVSTVFTEP